MGRGRGEEGKDEALREERRRKGVHSLVTVELKNYIIFLKINLYLLDASFDLCTYLTVSVCSENSLYYDFISKSQTTEESSQVHV